MRPLFPHWANSLYRASLAVAGLGIAGIPALLMIGARTPYATGQGEPRAQPVKFDHRHHVRDDGIACLYCHGDAARGRFAGVPSTATCMGCHAQVWTESPELAAVRASAIDDRPIVWNRVNALPGHVYFDHSIHVKKGVGCVTCHGRVDLMAQVFQAEPLTMAWCVDCHRDPDARLRPPGEVTNMEWAPTRPAAEIGREVAAALDVHPGTDCSTCHR